MNFRVAIGLALCLSIAASATEEKDKKKDPEFPVIRDYLRAGTGSDLSEFVNNHYIRLRLPRSTSSNSTKALALLTVVGIALTKSFAVVIRQENYEYYPNRYQEYW